MPSNLFAAPIHRFAFLFTFLLVCHRPKGQSIFDAATGEIIEAINQALPSCLKSSSHGNNIGGRCIEKIGLCSEKTNEFRASLSSAIVGGGVGPIGLALLPSFAASLGFCSCRCEVNQCSVEEITKAIGDVTRQSSPIDLRSCKASAFDWCAADSGALATWCASVVQRTQEIYGINSGRKVRSSCYACRNILSASIAYSTFGALTVSLAGLLMALGYIL